jgi:Domain of unknown function (DUF4397)
MKSSSDIRPRRLGVVIVTALAAVTLALANTAAPQQASAESTRLPAASATDGWMRVAHLSPDTKAVDITLTRVEGGQAVVELNKVAYGAVSPYIHIPAGTYAVAMTPWGAGASAKPILSASVDIVQGKTITVAALGKYKDLQAHVFQDDLAAPKAHDARIRLIQASTVTKSVNVKTSNGVVVATDAVAGQATSYASVPAGTWTLDLSSPSVNDSAAVRLKQGSVNTLFVLDNASGGLTVKSVLDSASVGKSPVGGINTGGGWASQADPLGLLSH